MRPAWILAALLLVPGVAAGQAGSALRVTVTLLDASNAPVPVGRHALLISDNPSTSEPRRVFTGTDGTVVVRIGSTLFQIDVNDQDGLTEAARDDAALRLAEQVVAAYS